MSRWSAVSLISSGSRQMTLPKNYPMVEPRASRIASTGSFAAWKKQVSYPGSGEYRTAAAGKSLLQTRPDVITDEMLEEGPASATKAQSPAQTPEERIEESYKAITEALADQLLDQLKIGTPAAFEQIVVDLLIAMGYGGANSIPGAVVGRSGDGGIDQ